MQKIKRNTKFGILIILFTSIIFIKNLTNIIIYFNCLREIGILCNRLNIYRVMSIFY